MYYEVKGEGVACVFVHGGPGAWSKDFELNAGKDLEKNFKMIYFDQRGCGRSGGNKTDDYSIDKIVDDLELIRISLNIDKWIMIAHSFGGVIATDYASKYEDKLHGLVLLNCTLNLEDSFKNIVEKGCDLLGLDCCEYSNIRGREFGELLTKLVRSNIHYKLQCKKESTYKYLDELERDIKNINMALQRETNDSYYENYFDISEKLNTKVLVIAGDEDYSVGINHHNNFKFQNSKTEIIKGKHVPHIEDKQVTAMIIRNFIEEIFTLRG